jgi:hypothetical protein
MSTSTTANLGHVTPTTNDRWLLPTLCVAGLVGGLLAASAPPNLDTAWYLLVTERMLQGAVFGKDLLETNPPLFIAFVLPSLILAKVFAADAYSFYCVWVGLLAAGSSYAAARCLAKLGLGATQQRIIAASVLCLELLLPGSSYGQREVVILALALPFILNETLRLGADIPPEPRLHLLAAGVAAFAFLLKPFYATIPAGLILWRMIKERSIRPAFSPAYLLMLALAVVYALSIPLFFPDWLALAQTAIGPAYPAGFNGPWPQVLDLVKEDAGLLVLASGIVWFAPAPSRRFLTALLIASALAYLGAIAQQKGWPYHLLPGRILLCLVLVLRVLTPDPARWSAVVRAGSGVIVAGLCVYFGLHTGWFNREEVKHKELSRIIAEANGQRVLAIRLGLEGVFPEVMEMKADWGSRFAHQWIAAGAAAKEASNDASERQDGARLRKMATDLVREDITRSQPEVITVGRGEIEGRRDGHGKLIDWVEWYNADPEFNRVWSGYCFSHTTWMWAVYRRCRPADGAGPS